MNGQSNMKIVKLSGGLGNQMFQYAFGQALKNAGDEVLYDAGWFEAVNKSKKSRATKRNYELGVFMADINLATPKQISLCSNEKFCGISLPAFLKRLVSRVVKEKCSSSFYKEFFSIKGDAYFAGVFANDAYFYDLRPELIKAFMLKDKMSDANMALLDDIKKTQSVSIHIRRGDFVKYGLVCNLDYYYRAVSYINSKVKNAHFYIFSDDVKWAKENLKIDNPHTFVDINDGSAGYCDLELMKNCRHNIAANSTFSWWAGYLNQNPDKIVLAPKDKADDCFRILFKGGYN